MTETIWERSKLVADAIVLERAARVIERRGQDSFISEVFIRVLNRMAAKLRRRAREAVLGKDQKCPRCGSDDLWTEVSGGELFLCCSNCTWSES